MRLLFLDARGGLNDSGSRISIAFFQIGQVKLGAKGEVMLLYTTTIYSISCLCLPGVHPTG